MFEDTFSMTCGLLQDAFCVEPELGDPTTHLFAVFDGHGKEGHLCAQYARAQLPVALRKSAHFRDDIGKAFSSACKQVPACPVRRR